MHWRILWDIHLKEFLLAKQGKVTYALLVRHALCQSTESELSLLFFFLKNRIGNIKHEVCSDHGRINCLYASGLFLPGGLVSRLHCVEFTCECSA